MPLIAAAVLEGNMKRINLFSAAGANRRGQGRDARVSLFVATDAPIGGTVYPVAGR